MARLRVDSVIVRIPKWVVVFYTALAILLIPWTIYMGWTLPTHHLSVNWDISWTGLDIALIIAFLLTGLAAYTKSLWIVISSTTVGCLLLVDAWFDVMTEHQSPEFARALLTGAAVEIPLALLSYYVAAHALQRVHKHTKHKR